jgi:hypothetical protein
MNSNDPRASVAAAKAILDRGYGKPAQLLGLSIDAVFRRITELNDEEMMVLEQRLLQISEQENGLSHAVGDGGLTGNGDMFILLTCGSIPCQGGPRIPTSVPGDRGRNSTIDWGYVPAIAADVLEDLAACRSRNLR